MKLMPEDGNGELRLTDGFERDNPDEWREICDDETVDPHEEEQDG